MASQLLQGAVHHLALTVRDVKESAAFYQEILGFQHMLDLGPRTLLSNGTLILGLTPPPDPTRADPADQFDENRIGLDHLSFQVENRAKLEEAVELFDKHGIAHGQVTDLGEAFGMHILAFRDPNNIQLELTAPY
jgi:glyoxylase I family protein